VPPLDLGDVQAELKTGPPPRHPSHPVPEALGGQRFAVGCCRERDARVRVQVIHVGSVHQAVHRRVNRRRRPAFAERAEVERRHHLVFALDTRIHVHQGTQRVQPQGGQARRGKSAEVAARALHPEQLGRLSGDRIKSSPLRGGVTAGVVGVARVRAQPVAAAEQLVNDLLHRDQAPHPAAEPPRRSETIFSP
jgi:hypothetical protein